MELAIPNDWDCMDHQAHLWADMDSGKKRAVAVWHRRAGKDSTALNYTCAQAIEKTGVYWHMLPTQTQARKVVWDGIDRLGRKMIHQVFPKQIRKSKHNHEMKIELINGSIWQLCGSDNYDSLVGANPSGVIFSEWSLCNPASWDFIRPILAENGGWAIFIYTARGKNHGFKMAQMARKNPSWHYSMFTVEDTRREDGSRIITQEAIQEDKDSGMSDDMVQQEYYCSFDVAIPGAYYAKEIASARFDKRICSIPIDPTLDVHTYWDLGISDMMTIWFVQAIGKEVRLIAYYENNNEGMAHYIQYLDSFQKAHRIQYGQHYAPHDIEVRELMSGKSRRDTARDMGIVFYVIPKIGISEGIEAVRRLFPSIWIDENRCEQGLNCITSYHRDYDEKKQVFHDQPVHDWSSHGADGLRGLAVSYDQRLGKNKAKHIPQTYVPTNQFSVFD